MSRWCLHARKQQQRRNECCSVLLLNLDELRAYGAAMFVELGAGTTQPNVRHVPGVPAFFGLVLMGVPGVPDGLSVWRACCKSCG